MTAFNAATIVVFASLGLVALALGLLVRRYSGSALATGLAGLLALTTALTLFRSTVLRQPLALMQPTPLA
jgi:hypothetical protein